MFDKSWLSRVTKKNYLAKYFELFTVINFYIENRSHLALKLDHFMVSRTGKTVSCTGAYDLVIYLIKRRVTLK